jgi:hypothetical protein
VDNPEDEGFMDISHFFPEASSMHIIKTTRSRTVAEMSSLEDVYVGEIVEGQAVELFCKTASLPAMDPEIKEEV